MVVVLWGVGGGVVLVVLASGPDVLHCWGAEPSAAEFGFPEEALSTFMGFCLARVP